MHSTPCGRRRKETLSKDADKRASRLQFLAFLALCLHCVALSAADTNALSLHLRSPLDYQVFQRQKGATTLVAIAGDFQTEIKGTALPDTLETKISAKSVTGALTNDWQRLPCDSRVASFRGQLAVPAGGWYELNIRALRNGVQVAVATVKHFGVGEVFVIAGQSNSANYGEERQRTKTGLVAAFDGQCWQLANDPQPGAGGNRGSFMPLFGDALAERLGVPIGIVARGVGSTSVREWLPPGTRILRLSPLTRNVITIGPGEWEVNGKIFNDFTSRMAQLGPYGFRAVLWHQGESDANQGDPERTLPGEQYRRCLEQLIRESRKVIGWEAPWFVAQVSSHGSKEDRSSDIRAAQKALWDTGVALEGPDTDALTGDMREKNGTGVHFSSQGLREHARLWTEKVAPWVEQQANKK